MSVPFRFLDEAATSRLLTMTDAVAACEAVLAEMGHGRASLSQPAAMFLRGDATAETLFKVKGGCLPAIDVCGFRVVGDVGDDGVNGEHHYCYLLDPVTAVPRALVSQERLHRMRTAACGLVTLKRLGATERPTVALIGAGRIAAEVVGGFAEVFPGGRLIVASRRFETAQALVAANRGADAEIIALPNAADAVAAADAVLTLTSSRTPVLDAASFRPGMTVCGMGEHGELPADLLRMADRFVVDDIGFAKVMGSVASWIRSGAVPEAEIDGHSRVTLGEVVTGSAPGRTSLDQRILAIIQGLAIADLALAKLCLDKALVADTPEPPLGARS